MQARLTGDPRVFLASAESLLVADEARHNLILGIAGTIRDHPGRYEEHRFWLVEEAAEAVAAALRTPPYNLVLARPRFERALDLLVETIDDDLPGVSGASPEVDLFAAAWAAKTGRRARVRMRQGIYRLDRLGSAPTAPGRAREASADDRTVLLAWWEAFLLEAGHGETASESELDATVRHRLAADDAGVLLWEDGDEPVAMAAFGDATPNGIRLGPVYTPPGLRGRGYGSALVADLSARLLWRHRFCFLYTNLENPTANRIYQRLGYRRDCDAAVIGFD